MFSTLRTRMGQGAAALLSLGIACDGLGTYLAYNDAGIATNGSTASHVASPATVYVVLTALGGFCIALAVVFAAGLVASLVIDEGLQRARSMDITSVEVEEFEADDDQLD